PDRGRPTTSSTRSDEAPRRRETAASRGRSGDPGPADGGLVAPGPRGQRPHEGDHGYGRRGVGAGRRRPRLSAPLRAPLRCRSRAAPDPEGSSLVSLYVYGVTAGVPRALGRGMRREPLRAIRHGRLAMIVGGADVPPLATPELLRAHDAAVRRLAARAEAILPARFGCVLSDDAEARRTLRTPA